MDIAQIDPSDMIAPERPKWNTEVNLIPEILSENPGLAKVHNPATTKLIFASPERVRGSKKFGGGGYLEYWPDDEPGSEDFPHPAPRNTVIEVYDKNIARDPVALKQMIYGDLLHGMVKDPEYKAMHDEFKANYTPETLAFEEERKKEGARNNWSVDAVHDMYIRGMLSPDSKDEFRKDQAKYGNVYSPKQLDIINNMHRYIKTGKR